MWWRLILALAFITALCLHVSEPLRAGGTQEATYIKVEVKGKLRTGIMAIGGETTGTIIETNAGALELDFGKNKELRELAGKLDGKAAIATGTLTFRKGVAIKQRYIVSVTSLKAADK
jgi:hypothetical protein